MQLGHGSVATYPDQPFLNWEFEYVSPRRRSGLRENPKTFLAGCQRVHEILIEARARLRGNYDDPAAFRPFKEIESAVNEILAVEGDAEIRAGAWSSAMRAGRISRVAEEIPEYDSTMFTSHLSQLWSYDQAFAKKTLTYVFLEAADFHRSFILNDLLPRNGVHIESAPIEWHT